MLTLNKRLLYFFIFCCISAVYQPSYAQKHKIPDLNCRSEQCIRIGTFNIEWLGSKRRRGLPFRNKTDIAMVSKIITDEAKLDIVVLQEINSDFDGIKQKTSYSTKPYLQLKTLLEQKGYELSVGESGGQQQIAIAWKKEDIKLQQTITELDNQPFKLDKGCRSMYIKKPLAANFKAGNFDFWLVGLHLKSQRGKKKCSDQIRQAQITNLLNGIDELSKTEKDILLVGDFNVDPNYISLVPLQEEGFINVTKPEKLSSYSAAYSYIKGQYQNTIDQLIIHNSSVREWVNNSTTIVYAKTNERSFTEYLKRISDHTPVWASFITSLPDDD